MNIENEKESERHKSLWEFIIKVVAVIISLGSLISGLLTDEFWLADLATIIAFIIISIFIYRYLIKKSIIQNYIDKKTFLAFKVIWWLFVAVLSINFISSKSFINVVIDKLDDQYILCRKITSTPIATTAITKVIDIPQPNVGEPSIESGVSTPTSTLAPSSTPSLESSFTPTFFPTNTPTQKFYNIKIGIFNLGENCLKKENQDKLIELGFLVEQIEFDTTFQELLGFDVLYFSSGWCCKNEIIKDDNFYPKMESYLKSGKGILIGDPDPISDADNCSIKFLPISFDYEKITDVESYLSYNTCKYSPEENCKTHWIIYEQDEINFPIPESKLVLPENNLQHWVLTRQCGSYNPSLVIGSGIDKYWVLLPGSEPSSNKKIISDDILKNIILWLSKQRPFDNEGEWYIYE